MAADVWSCSDSVVGGGGGGGGGGGRYCNVSRHGHNQTLDQVRPTTLVPTQYSVVSNHYILGRRKEGRSFSEYLY